MQQIHTRFRKSSIYRKFPTRLYGIGCSNKMLTLLEEGKVCAAVICNEYDKGYLSVEAAMKSIQNGTRQRTVKMEQVLVRQENLYDKEYEALLFQFHSGRSGISDERVQKWKTQMGLLAVAVAVICVAAAAFKKKENRKKRTHSKSGSRFIKVMILM